jgi:hypothetical protein
MILLAHRCYTAPQIAHVVLLSEDTMCVLKRFMAGGLADVFSEQVRATVARSTLRGCVAMMIADNLMLRTAQSSRLVCRLLTELSGQMYLIYTHAFDPNANGTLLALAVSRPAVTHNHQRRDFESLLADVKSTLTRLPRPLVTCYVNSAVWQAPDIRSPQSQTAAT